MMTIKTPDFKKPKEVSKFKKDVLALTKKDMLEFFIANMKADYQEIVSYCEREDVLMKMKGVANRNNKRLVKENKELEEDNNRRVDQIAKVQSEFFEVERYNGKSLFLRLRFLFTGQLRMKRK